MSTSTSTLTESNPTSRQISSVSSLSASQSAQPSSIARIYRQASQLFVTRRIKEALETLEPVIQRSELPRDDLNGESYEQSESRIQEQQAALIASASRGARVKIWSLYISIVNEVVEMGPDAGKQTFGASRWKHFVTMARDGSLWTEIVDVGYTGAEGDVDAEVVANLATLLLAHAPTQKLTQQRLETYLSASTSPSLDVAGHLERRKDNLRAQANGTSTPRDLNSRLKILEIYTLHVLPRNSEWEYAREFITMSEILDEERKEAFHQALQNIQDEKEFDSKREEELQKQREQQLEDARRRDEDARKAFEARNAENRDRRRQQQESQKVTEHDYGIDASHIGRQNKPATKQPSGAGRSSAKLPIPDKTSSSKTGRSQGVGSGKSASTSPTMMGRFAFLMNAFQHSVVSMGQNVRSHPRALLRMLALLVALLMALSRRDIRNRLARARDASWDKLKQTVGMGVKVSYI